MITAPLVRVQVMPDVSGAATDRDLVELWLATRGAAKTRRDYRHDSGLLLAHLQALGLDLRSMTVAAFASWASGLTGAPATVARRLSAARSLMTFARRAGYLTHDVSAVVRMPRVPRDLSARILTESQVQAIVCAAKGRLQLMLLVLYATGLRISEACELRWRDVHVGPYGDAVLSVRGKGGKLRHVRLGAEIVRDLGGPAQPDAPVFATKVGTPVAPRYIGAQLQRLSLKVLKKHVSPHWFRHAHASHALDHGAPVHVVQATLGHDSLATTTAYVHAKAGASSGDYLPSMRKAPAKPHTTSAA